jgi:hypothetical protein
MLHGLPPRKFLAWVDEAPSATVFLPISDISLSFGVLSTQSPLFPWPVPILAP